MEKVAHVHQQQSQRKVDLHEGSVVTNMVLNFD